MSRAKFRLTEIQNSIKTMNEANSLNETLRFELSKLGYVLSENPGYQTEYYNVAEGIGVIHVNLYSKKVFKRVDLDISSMYPAPLMASRDRYRLLTNEELKLFDSLGFELSEEHMFVTEQNIEDWYSIKKF